MVTAARALATWLGQTRSGTMAGLAAAMLWLAGCTVQLVPSYDPALVSGLQDLNQQSMTFFASVSAGTGASDFANRQDTYNSLIGSANALQIEAASRPDPLQSDGWFGKKVMQLEKADSIPKLQAPTPTILTNLAQAFTVMRDTDQKQGLTSVEVQAFQGQFSIYMGQALTFEKALQQ